MPRASSISGSAAVSVNPVGGVEALATRLIGEALDKPCAHGPVDYALTGFKEVVDPRIAVEIITENFIHCLLKGLHKAPRLSTISGMSIVIGASCG